MTFALAFPVLVGAAGLAVDSAAFYNQQSRMQSAADSTALAVAKELHLFANNADTLAASGEARAEALLAEVGLEQRPHSTQVSLDADNGLAHVEISMTAKAFLPVDVWGENPIVVSSQARAFGQAKLCVLGLDRTGSYALLADNASSITAAECAVQSNSRDANALVVQNGSDLVSAYTCTAGGYQGPARAFEPTPETDCPQLDDPLSSRAPPTASGCDYNDLVIDSGTQTISPGVYCGGLVIQNSADVWASPGTYIFTGGKLMVKNNAAFAGDDVSFYFADDAALLEFIDAASIRLTAPKDGPMAGLLFMEAQTASPGRSFVIKSPHADVLLGTIYLPKGILLIETAGNVADQSDFTVIVADRIDVKAADLVINANYAGTDVPVPDGLGPNSSMVQLSQ